MAANEWFGTGGKGRFLAPEFTPTSHKCKSHFVVASLFRGVRVRKSEDAKFYVLTNVLKARVSFPKTAVHDLTLSCRFSLGDCDVPFCIQSTSKPLNYALAISDLRSSRVHKYVGQEPSGRSFNELTLDYNSTSPWKPVEIFGVTCFLFRQIQD